MSHLRFEANHAKQRSFQCALMSGGRKKSIRRELHSFQLEIINIKRYDTVTKRLRSSKLNIHVHSLLLQEKQPDVIIVNDGDSSDIRDKGGGKKTNVSNICSFLIILSYTTLAKA